jgi:hypothetical protein
LPRVVDPQLTDQIYLGLFGILEHPGMVEPGDVTDTTRLLLVKEGRGVTATVYRSLADLQIPGLVFRRVEEPAPMIEHGILWQEENVSPFVSEFVSVARHFAEGSATRRNRDLVSTVSSGTSPYRHGMK